MSNVNVKEGDIKLVANDDDILYPEISSCLTITCELSNHTRIGAHLVQKPTQHMISAADYIEMVDSLRNGLDVIKIIIAGDAAASGGNLEQVERRDTKGQLIPKEQLSINLEEEKEAWGTKHFGTEKNNEGATNIGFLLGVHFNTEEVYAIDGSTQGDLKVDNKLNLSKENHGESEKITFKDENIFKTALFELEDFKEDEGYKISAKSNLKPGKS